MVQSKSKRTARAVSLGGLPRHPALVSPDPLLQYRLGESLPLRLPDAENQPSAATILRSEYTGGSDAAGNMVFAEAFSSLYAKLAWTVTAGVCGAAAVTTQHPQHTAFVAEARAARMVAMRIQVLYVGVDQESSGYLSYSEKADANDVNSQTVDGLHTGSDIQVRATDGLMVYVDYTQLPRWEPPGGATFMQYTFPIALFTASGLPANKASLFRIKVERFLEYLPVEGALAEGELKHEPYNPGAIAAHGALSGPASSVTSSSDKNAFYARVKEIANAAYHMAQPMLPYVVPKARETLTRLAATAMPLLLTM